MILLCKVEEQARHLFFKTSIRGFIMKCKVDHRDFALLNNPLVAAELGEQLMYIFNVRKKDHSSELFSYLHKYQKSHILTLIDG